MRKAHYPGNLRPRAPSGRRLYAIGDIHGEAELLRKLLRMIADDAQERQNMRTTIVFLGDLIDRGPSAAQLLSALYGTDNSDLIFLKGNHEATLVDVCHGDEEALEFWLEFGGRATLHDMNMLTSGIKAGEIVLRIKEVCGAGIVSWLDGLPSSYQAGDYFFCHAGVRPGVELAYQGVPDLLWIREPFLSSRRDHGKVIVHGHTVELGLPVLGGNRIGLDTGAHEHGCLTALGLEGDQQWLLQARS